VGRSTTSSTATSAASSTNPTARWSCQGRSPSMTCPTWGGAIRGPYATTGGEKVLVDGRWLVAGGSGGRPPRHPAPPAPSTAQPTGASNDR